MTICLQHYSKFNTSEDIHKALTLHAIHKAKSLNKSDRKVLDVIRRHAVDNGVAQLNYKTFQEETGKSNATVRRGIRKLVQLGIIEKVHFIHPVVMGLGANIYILLPFDESLSLSKP